MSQRSTRRARTRSSSRKSTPTSLTSVLVLVVIIIIAAVLANNNGLLDRLGLGTTLDATPTTQPGLPTQPVAGQPTQAPSGDLSGIEIYFTRPIYPDKPENRPPSPLIDRFVAMLNSATSSIDMAIYELDIPEVVDALVNASKRGVTVRVVTDSDSLDSDDAAMKKAYSTLKSAKIPVVPDERSAIMHDKFVVVDRLKVWMGSWNFTEGDTYRLNNNAALIDSPSLAANYTAEFRRMFEEKHFGPSKEIGSGEPEQTIGDSPSFNYFAPVDKIEPKLIDLVKSAQKSIYFMAFQYTLDDLGDAMAQRAQDGITVSGVFETTGSETQFSEYGKLLKLNLPVYQDGNPYIMHHKVIVVDEQTVAFGSFNFSSAAEDSNDENILIVYNPALAAKFVQEFEYVRGVAQKPVK